MVVAIPGRLAGAVAHRAAGLAGRHPGLRGAAFGHGSSGLPVLPTTKGQTGDPGDRVAGHHVHHERADTVHHRPG